MYKGSGTTIAAGGTYELTASLESTKHRPKEQSDGGNQNTCTTEGATACKYEAGTNLTLF